MGPYIYMYMWGCICSSCKWNCTSKYEVNVDHLKVSPHKLSPSQRHVSPSVLFLGVWNQQKQILTCWGIFRSQVGWKIKRICIYIYKIIYYRYHYHHHYYYYHFSSLSQSLALLLVLLLIYIYIYIHIYKTAKQTIDASGRVWMGHLSSSLEHLEMMGSH